MTISGMGDPKGETPTINFHYPHAMLSRSIGGGTFEPRVIRPPGVSRGSCVDTTLSSSATRNRRASTSNILTTVPSSQRAGFPAFPQLSSHQSISPLPSVPFQRPAYLEHSSLKHLLQTEFPPLLPPGRYGRDVGVLDDDQNSRNVTHPYPRRRRTPLIESDDEDPFTPPRELLPLVSTHPPSGNTLSPVLRLPTRWSDQDRHLSLTVSPDGRELTFAGKSGFQPNVTANSRTQVCRVSVTKMLQQLAQTIPSHLHVESITTKWKS